MSKTTVKDDTIVVTPINLTEMRFNLVGTTMLVPHSTSAHAKGQLLFPSPKKNAAEKATTMKHEPWTEFREAAYRFSDQEAGATRLYMPAGAVKGALKDVAIDMVGARKSQVGRLTTVLGVKLPLYGVPKIYTTLVRSSDMNRTPDVRTLPAIERWAIPGVTIRFVNSLIKEASVANLLANAGIIIGIGDGRPQKGYFDFGTWRLAADDDEELQEIVASGGINAQDAALDEPEFFDLESEQLLTWFLQEQKKRSATPPSAGVASPRKNGKGQRDRTGPDRTSQDQHNAT